MPQAVPCPAEPPTGLCGPAIEPGGRALPQVLRGVVKVQDARGMSDENCSSNRRHNPRPPSLSQTTCGAGRMPWRSASSHRRGCEHLDVPQDGHQPALSQPAGRRVPAACDAAPAGQHTHFDLAPADLPSGAPASGRNGTMTPSAPRANGKAASSAASGSGVGPSPLATASSPPGGAPSRGGQPLAPSTTRHAGSPRRHSTSPATAPPWQRAQRPRTHSPAHWSSPLVR